VGRFLDVARHHYGGALCHGPSPKLVLQDQSALDSSNTSFGPVICAGRITYFGVEGTEIDFFIQRLDEESWDININISERERKLVFPALAEKGVMNYGQNLHYLIIHRRITPPDKIPRNSPSYKGMKMTLRLPSSNR
jgi:hypothetical protein